MRRLWLLSVFVLLLAGCAGVNRAVDDYDRCVADPVCHTQLHEVRDVAYEKVKASTSGLPTLSEAIAFVVSNVVMFGVGVLKGRKKG